VALASAWAALLSAFLAASAASPARAQSWTADLMIDPYPSPYVSDWEANAAIASLTVFNHTERDGTVRLSFTITDHTGSVLARGTSDPETLPPGPTEYNSPFQLSGSFDYDVDLQDVIVRTGRLPEGDFTACTVVSSTSGFVLARACSTFTVLYPDPPMLTSPFDGETVTTRDPFFEWTPLQLPAGFPVYFVVQVAKVERGQTPYQALTASIPQFQESDLMSTSFQYPLGALPLEPGAEYAWRVQAIGQNGYPVSANDGWSEIGTFSYVDAAEGIADVRIDPGADTLALAGDTARLVAHALDENDFELSDVDVQWSSTNTAVATVDSTGLVSGVGPGRTLVVATSGGVADTASIITWGGGSDLRITFYDPQTAETPELYTLLKSGSYREIADSLRARLASGDFEIPLAVPAGMTAMRPDTYGSDRLAWAVDGSRVPGGPYASSPVSRPPDSPPGALDCARSDLTLPYYAYFDDDRKAFAIGMRPSEGIAADKVEAVLDCLGLSGLGAARSGQKLELLLSGSATEPGSAHVSLGIKVPTLGPLADRHLQLDYVVIVDNFGNGYELDASKMLPGNAPEVTAFYPYPFQVAGADASLEVGTEGSKAAWTGPGTLNVYGRLDLSGMRIESFLDRLGFQEHAIALQGVLSYGGSAASNTAGDTTTSRTAAVGTLHLAGTLPKRTPRLGVVSRYIHWMQAGVSVDIALASTATSGGADTTTSSSVTVTPKLTHTMELQLPFPRWPALTLRGSIGLSGSQSTPTGAAGDSAAAEGDTTAASSDTAAAGGDSVGSGSTQRKMIVSYRVSSGGDSTLVLWDFLHLSLGAQVTYTFPPTTSSPPETEFELSGTTGLGSMDEAVEVSVAYARKGSTGGGEGRPPGGSTSDTTSAGEPTTGTTGGSSATDSTTSRTSGASEKEKGDDWTFKLKMGKVGFGELFRNLREIVQAIR